MRIYKLAYVFNFPPLSRLLHLDAVHEHRISDINVACIVDAYNTLFKNNWLCNYSVG